MRTAEELAKNSDIYYTQRNINPINRLKAFSIIANSLAYDEIPLIAYYGLVHIYGNGRMEGYYKKSVKGNNAVLVTNKRIIVAKHNEVADVCEKTNFHEYILLDDIYKSRKTHGEIEVLIKTSADSHARLIIGPTLDDNLVAEKSKAEKEEQKDIERQIFTRLQEDINRAIKHI